jgi:glycosyltransferase involved in cell wall biosynthesis
MFMKKNHFSIIIPTRNRTTHLQETLKHLAQVEYDKNYYEVIVVNNNSNLEMEKKLHSYNKVYNFTLVNEKNIGPSFARNAGVQHARFPILIFLDDDCLVKKDFLHLFNEKWNQFPAAGVIGGKVAAVLQKKKMSSIQKQQIKKHSWVFGQLDFGKDRVLELGETLFGGNMSCRKGIERCIFDTHFGREIFSGKVLVAEDYELCQRLMLKKKPVLYFQDIEVSNVINVSRFDPHYIYSRYWQAGIETYLIDQKFKNFAQFRTYPKRIRKDWPGFLSSSYAWVMLISYVFNGPQFLYFQQQEIL